MTAPKICEHCGAALDPGETCDCMKEDQDAMDKAGLGFETIL